MTTLTIGKILKTYKNHLTDYELKQLKKIQTEQTSFSEQVQALKSALFGEEWDFMMREISDDGNPMSDAYTDRVNKKRAAFGVGPINDDGFPTDDSSQLFCEEVVRHSKNYKELLELKRKKAKQIVFVDMDNVLVNFQSGIDRISEEEKEQYKNDLDNVPGIFSLMDPYEGAIEGYQWLAKNFDTYILSTAPWKNPSAWTDKLLWVQKHLPEVAEKRLILSHNKQLAHGDFLIDDRTANGAGDFKGKHIHFCAEDKGFKDWKAVVSYLKNLA
ncbi:5' nucleotidase, NT5C type [Winogradskyella arenosi]|uniref:Deoxypyrimidine-specific 5' nucleotidase type C protein (NT5C) n=1 Tax=Winogradskyella arenosi TaxID=533325 RepID=A0A368ZKL2_9FLAO|nr:hypothetical protein [Winogradskyella arenosi]RCW93445.1 deoxypyrimidine-specific 5' nucleotidase type C protein (NT5C) [Winogradskyella arenosi]